MCSGVADDSVIDIQNLSMKLPDASRPSLSMTTYLVQSCGVVLVVDQMKAGPTQQHNQTGSRAALPDANNASRHELIIVCLILNNNRILHAVGPSYVRELASNLANRIISK